MFKKFRQCLIFLSLFLSSNVHASMSDQCPSSDYFGGLVSDVCWSCIIPISLFGGLLGDAPDGAYDSFLCSCKDDLGIPMPGFNAGFFQPDQILELSNVPYCSPTLGGVQLSSDYVHIANSSHNKDTINSFAARVESEPLVQMHYNYLANPIMKMMNVLMIPECDKSPGVVDLDIMFMSPLTIEWYDDMLSMLLQPDAIAFANPIGAAACMVDCGETMVRGKASERNWHCAGCEGSLYPLTGNATGSSDNPIRTAALLSQRAIAKSHRLGLSPLTMGKDAMCEYVYTPTIPKPQYKMQIAFPFKQSASNQKCCHPLGENWMKYGLGRIAPGGGKDSTIVYNVFRYTDCCIPWLTSMF
ncbi:TraU family protein [Photobacterium sp. ZSDE20]|uniref:TraU family protein n=1 Tax=Photobacterium pectinilyticum TaxID=2906793 RepID=A0ABT1N6A6_9GAMM|nr:TraU family protein [Photobacterium sp. ZSDE20]MCQ1060277.1 TraU family protein [Photobacterium sp. ZSDE20]MDD1826264.1 TraU family protein [Photobacterium sp. ZSDE20]